MIVNRVKAILTEVYTTTTWPCPLIIVYKVPPVSAKYTSRENTITMIARRLMSALPSVLVENTRKRRMRTSRSSPVQ